MDREYLTTLREVKTSRCDSIAYCQVEAENLLLKLGGACSADNELLKADYVQPTVENVEKLKCFLDELNNAFVAQNAEIQAVKGDVVDIWNSLNWPVKERKRFMEELGDDASEITLLKLKAELERCTLIKSARIPAFIQKAREQLVIYSDKCKESDDFRHNSIMFDVRIDDESSLQIHESELRYLKRFYDENAHIFSLLADRNRLKSQLEVLVYKQSDSSDTKDRLKNRGGRLLKEENERKILERSLLKAEAELSKAVEEFEAKHKRPFEVDGAAVEHDVNAKSRLAIKKQYSSSNLQLKRQPFGDRSNQQT